MLALSLHSRRHESARPLRNTATAYFVPTLRARREAPSLVPGSGVGLLIFQPASALSTGQYKWAVSKQRKPPQTANRLDGRHAPVAAAQEKGNFSLWTKPYRQCGLVGYKRLVPGAAHQFCLTCLTCPTKRRTARSCTLRAPSSTGGLSTTSALLSGRRTNFV